MTLLKLRGCSFILCVIDTNDSWFGTIQLTQKSSIWKLCDSKDIGILVPLNVFLFAKTLLVGWGGRGGEKRPFYTVSEVFVFCFFTLLNKYFCGFLTLKASWSTMKDPAGTEAAAGTDNPLGLQLCNKGVLGRVVPGDGRMHSLHSYCEWPRCWWSSRS